jgi:hypothetical protein
MFEKVELNMLVEAIKQELDYSQIPTEYGYKYVPLCIIDAIFSIGVHYNGVTNTITRFCQNEKIQIDVNSIRNEQPRENQFTINDMISLYETHGLEYVTEKIFNNKQRTSTTNGILKAQAVLEFCKICKEHGINYYQDISKLETDKCFELKIRYLIPGQSSGISLKYFFMLVGSENFVKADRMLCRFVEQAINQEKISIEKCDQLVIAASKELGAVDPKLTPRNLDYLIWNYQRQNK